MECEGTERSLCSVQNERPGVVPESLEQPGHLRRTHTGWQCVGVRCLKPRATVVQKPLGRRQPWRRVGVGGPERRRVALPIGDATRPSAVRGRRWPGATFEDRWARRSFRARPARNVMNKRRLIQSIRPVSGPRRDRLSWGDSCRGIVALTSRRSHASALPCDIAPAGHRADRPVPLGERAGPHLASPAAGP